MDMKRLCEWFVLVGDIEMFSPDMPMAYPDSLKYFA